MARSTQPDGIARGRDRRSPVEASVPPCLVGRARHLPFVPLPGGPHIALSAGADMYSRLLGAVMAAIAAAILVSLRWPSRSRRDMSGRALGWDTAEEIKQAASPAIAHEPGALR